MTTPPEIPTPRTDAEGTELVPIDFARQLERELLETKKEVDRFRKAICALEIEETDLGVFAKDTEEYSNGLNRAVARVTALLDEEAGVFGEAKV